MSLPPDRIGWPIAAGVPAVIEVRGHSMAPSIEEGARLRVEPVMGELRPGDLVLIAGRDLPALHRVVHCHREHGRCYLAHQGDAPATAFGICTRESVIGRPTGFASDPSRALPTLDRLDATARRRFFRRRVACASFVGARRLALSLGLRDRTWARRCGRFLRAVSGALGA